MMRSSDMPLIVLSLYISSTKNHGESRIVFILKGTTMQKKFQGLPDMDYKEFNRSFRYRKTTQSIPSLLDGIRSERIRWDPMFTYTKSWSIFSKSTFIESILVGMPAADILCEENHYGELFVLDGVQRLICLQEFFNDEFSLQYLKLIPSLNNHRYSELPYAQASIFHNRTELDLTIISYDTDAILKFEFFKRFHSDSYRFPIQLARNYAFRENLYFIRELQNITHNNLTPKSGNLQKISISTSKANHKAASDFDELYLMLCCASLTYHNRISYLNNREYSKFSDLLDETAIYLHRNPEDFNHLKNVVVNALDKASRVLRATIIFTDLSSRGYFPYENINGIELDSESIVACFIESLKDRYFDLEDFRNRKYRYKNSMSPQNFLKNIHS